MAPVLAESVPATFVAIRFPGLGLVLSRHTQQVAGSQADAGVLAVARDSDGVEYTVLAALRGFGPAHIEALSRDIAAAYGRPPTLVCSGPGETVLRYRWAMRDLQSPMLRALVRIRRSFGQVWTHVEGGRMTLYAPVRSASARKAIHRLAEHLAHLGLPADVEAMALGQPEHAAFERMQHLLATTPVEP